MARYRYKTITEHGFIQQLACSYANRGYELYFKGVIPEAKDPAIIDAKLIAEYNISASKAERWRRKKAGRANIQYLRFRRDFLLLATHGEHPFFEKNQGRIFSLARHPLKFHGYSVSLKGGHTVVRISKEQYKLLKASFQSVALQKSADVLGQSIDALPYERYRGVIKQLFQLVKAVNTVRAPAGLPKVQNSCIRVKRRILKPFEAQAFPAPESVTTLNFGAQEQPQASHTS